MARDDGRESFLPPIDGISGRHPRRQLPDVLGHVAQEAAHHGQRFVFAVDDIVDRSAGSYRDIRAAEFLTRQLLAQRSLHHRRAGGENLAGAAHHDREMRQNRPPGRAARGHAQHCARHRHDPEQFDRAFETVHAGKHRVPAALDRSHAAAGAVDQIDQGNAILKCQILDQTTLSAFAAIRAPAGAAANGEVLAADGDVPPVDLAEADDVGSRHDLLDRIVRVIRPLPREFRELAEASCIEQPIDALAYRHSSGAMLRIDSLRPAEVLRPAPALVYFVDLGLPAH